MQDNLITDLGVAQKLLNTGNLKKAESVCRRIIRETPGQPDALNMLAVIGIRRGETRRAIRYLKEAVARRPQDAVYRYNMGLAMLKTGNLP